MCVSCDRRMICPERSVNPPVGQPGLAPATNESENGKSGTKDGWTYGWMDGLVKKGGLTMS